MFSSKLGEYYYNKTIRIDWSWYVAFASSELYPLIWRVIIAVAEVEKRWKGEWMEVREKGEYPLYWSSLLIDCTLNANQYPSHLNSSD